MNRIEEMIKEMCPDGVVMVELGNVVNILDSQRRPISKGKRVSGCYPYYGANGIQDYVDNYIFDGTFLLFGEDGSVINKDNSPILTWATGKIWVNNHAHVLSENKETALLRYIYYVLQVTDVSDIVHGTPPKINQANLRSIEIPLPPLSIQQEIVKILDSFTALQQNLEDELKLRQKQYEHYREKLLTFEDEDDDVEWKKLGEVCIKYCSGSTPKKTNKEFYDGGNIPWLRTQDVKFNEIYEIDSFITEKAVEKTSVKWIPKNCVIVAISGATAGRCAINKIPTTTNQHCLNIEINKDIAHYKYVFFCVRNQYEELLSLKQGARGDLTSTLILNLQIPIPSIEKQSQIVQTLDHFESLISNLKTEIELRKKQYEYYREKLLTFE